MQEKIEKLDLTCQICGSNKARKILWNECQDVLEFLKKECGDNNYEEMILCVKCIIMIRSDLLLVNKYL
jgi:hypothetical protein